jgi:aspartyl aminopeptidase
MLKCLALTVDRGVNDSFKFNQETEFVPILGLLESQFNSSEDPDDDKSPPKPKSNEASSIQGNHHPALLRLLAEELSVAPEEIHDFELYVYHFVVHPPKSHPLLDRYMTHSMQYLGV